ncbi:DUF4145 domain-containing protein [Pseudotabrizicola formosa]|uniref:DUF4145 domain-containing protein n=1 Tax=Pseudotabrizicola formosa TaxID=2030009 RepID=UPI0011AFAB84|nr:DUF4145 domain-containing protein [Pseudotabrizicola formosa]
MLLLSTGVSEKYIMPHEGSSAIDERINKLLSEAVQSFNAGRYGESSNQIRRALEGSLKKSLHGKALSDGDQQKTLHALINLAVQHVDFSDPLKKLAILAKDIGNMGSHFNDDGDPSPELVREQIEATKYIVSYLFELPNSISEMQALIDDNKRPVGDLSKL